MPPFHLPPSESQTQADLLRRVDALEFKLDKSKQQTIVDPVRQRPCVFSLTGIATSGVRSGKWRNKNGDSFTLATIMADTSGGSACDVDILLNGTTLLTVTLGSGETFAEFAAVFVVGPTDVIQVESTAAGGQTEVTVELE